jgi:phenylalanyl-tRNA synthetase beta chain
LKIDLRNKSLGQMGIVSKSICRSFDIDTDVYFAELNWDAILKATGKNSVEFAEISKFPAVSRDLALLVDKKTTFAEIEQIARKSEKKLLKEITLFDVYEGKNLPEGKKSYAVNFVLQDEEKTLNDKQIDAVMQKIRQNLEKELGAVLR